MKIVQAVGWYFPESVGGTEVYVHGLAERLRRLGHDVVIAAPDPRTDREREDEHDGFRVYRYPIAAQPTRAEAQGADVVRGAERFHRWLALERPDVVHFHTFVTGLGLHEVGAAKSAGARVIVTSHAGSLGFVCARGTMMQWGDRLCDGLAERAKCAACMLDERGVPRPAARVLAAVPRPVSRLFSRVPGRLGTALSMGDFITRNLSQQRELLARVDRFVLLTPWAAAAVEANGAPPGRVAVNRLGLAARDVRRKPPPANRPTRPPVQIAYVGRLDPIKGVFDLAHAAASLPRALAFTVVFRGPERAEGIASEILRVAAGDPRVRVEPAIPPDAVPEVLASADLLCCPAICLEGGPTVAIEAHAVGTPVIGTRIGALADLVIDRVNGRLVEPGDRRALAEVVAEVAADPGLVDRWRAALPPARTLDEVTSEYLAMYAA